MASCACFSWFSAKRSKGRRLLVLLVLLVLVGQLYRMFGRAPKADKAIPVWRHPHISWKDKLGTYISRMPLAQMATLRYPEDGDEIKRLRSELSDLFGKLYRMLGRLDRWSIRTELYTRADGTQGQIRLHEPKGSVDPPLLIWLHGGGFTVGTIDDPNGIRLANALLDRDVPVLLAIVDYRLAPEHPFPAALEDCYTALNHLVDLNPNRPVHVAGASAGATLAASMVVEFAQRGQNVFKSALLDCPFVDPECSNPSYKVNARLIPDGSWLRWCWDVYLGRSAAEKKAAQGLELLRQLIEQSGGEGSALPLAPPRAPPVFVVTALADPLYDEGQEYVQLLKRCGAELDHWEAKSSHASWIFNDAATTARVLDRWAPLLTGAPKSRM